MPGAGFFSFETHKLLREGRKEYLHKKIFGICVLGNNQEMSKLRPAFNQPEPK